ncbi:MAG: GNAT family N-acetyltransferase [Burkholderiaceae bacterium]
MSPEEQLVWPKQRIGDLRDAQGHALAGGARSSKKRSPGAIEQEMGQGAPAAEAALRDDEQRRPSQVVTQYVPEEACWTTRIIRSTAEFEGARDAWSALLAESVDANVFMSHEWLFAWWTAYQPDAELVIVVAEDRGRVRGIAPLMIQTITRGGIRTRWLRFIGDGTGETDHINLLTPVTERARVLEALLGGIAAIDWDVAEFNQVPEASANTEDLMRWMDASGLQFTVSSSPCPIRRLPASHEALLSTLPSRLRTSLRSSIRKLREAHTLEFGQHQDIEELDSALRTFFENHESRWQGKGKAGAFSNPRRQRFYERLTPRLLERGWLRFFFLKLDGRPVAQQYCFALDGTAMLLQEGFDFSHAQDNVGNVLRSMVFEHLIQSGADCYDFLAGSSRHKQSWSDGSVNDLQIRCARRSIRGWLFFSVPRLVDRVKGRLRPWRDRLFAKLAKSRN